MAATYEDRFRAGLEPDSIDKEFLRRWYVARCDPYAADTLPEAPSELVNELARRYYMIVYFVSCTRSYHMFCAFIHSLDIS